MKLPVGKVLAVALVGLASFAARADFVLNEVNGPFTDVAMTFMGGASWNFTSSFDLTFMTTVTGTSDVKFTLTGPGINDTFSYLQASATGGSQSQEFKNLGAGDYKFSYVANTGANSAFGAKLTSSIAPTAPVPEPQTYAMLLAGLGVVGVMARRRLG